MKDPKSLLLGVDIPEGFSVEIVQGGMEDVRAWPWLRPEVITRHGFAIFNGAKRLAVVKTLRGLRIALMYFSKQEEYHA